MSGVGGGIVRDVLSGSIPGVLCRSGVLDAPAAVAGAASTYLLDGLHPAASLLAGTVVTVGVRVGSLVAGIQLPTRAVRPVAASVLGRGLDEKLMLHHPRT